ncbi:E1-E2 ATPase [Gracilaria domingensis]|nr:E1-E2 ATPase [Gracilaria domingensis]
MDISLNTLGKSLPATATCFISSSPAVFRRTISFSPWTRPPSSLRPKLFSYPTQTKRISRDSVLQRRLTPSCQSPCQSHGCHNHDIPKAEGNNPLISSLSVLASVQTSIRAASTGAILLSLATALHIATLSSLLIRASLLGCFALTGVPALANSSLRVIRSRGRTVDVNVLMSIAAAVCICTGALFEGALLTTLYAVSHAVEDWITGRARRELESLRHQTPSFALRVDSPTSSESVAVPVDDVVTGDFLLVKTGEVLPCDGQVASGDAFVSMQHLTGEPTPRHVEMGDDVPAGCKTEDASIVVRVSKIGAESYLARIARLVTAAQENRPQVTKFFDRFGQIYARSVLLISFAIALSLPLISSLFASVLPSIRYAGRSGSVARALGFLVVASPCALLIGAPIAYLAALSACARKGILAKSGARSLEAASRATHIVFDKTGTLTTGKLTLTSASELPQHTNKTKKVADANGNGISSQRRTLDSLGQLEGHHLSRIISAAAALNRGAVHPIATALHNRARQLGAPFPHITETRTIAGQGVEGVLSFEDEEHGSAELAGRLGRPAYILPNYSPDHESIIEDATSRGEIVSILEIAEDRYLLRLKDEVRPDAQPLVQQLQRLGYDVSILTGDNAGAAKAVSDSVGGGVKVIANATPEEKLKYVQSLESDLETKNGGIFMVGDGVNDAAALASALVGVACGLSSATAVHAADVVLVREELANVEWFMQKAKATERIVRQNLALALGLMVLSAGACVAGSIPLWLAVTLHEGGTLLVGINGLRLLSGR